MGFWESIGRIGGNDAFGDWNAWGLLGESDSEKDANASAAASASAAAKTEGWYTSRGLVNPNSKDATGMAAKLLKAQFTDWQKSFMPIELQAIQGISFNNPAVLSDAVSKASSIASNQSSAMKGISERQNAALGVAPTPQQRQVTDRILNLSGAANVAGAENTARTNVRTMDEQLLLGATPNPNIVKGTIQQ